MSNNNTVLCIAAHSHTMAKMQKYCFNQNYFPNRNKFDLCVVFNDVDSETHEYVKTLDPEYLFVKRNFGLDQSAFDYAINHTKQYENYYLLHYDHWFTDANWFDRLNQEIEAKGVDVLGNLVRPATLNFPQAYQIVSTAFGLGDLLAEKFDCFLQGGAGLYRASAIEALKSRGGIPYGRSNNREIAFICERLQSFLLLDSGVSFGQIEPGYERYLKHAEF
jgi:hypothetical protein